MLDTSWFVKVIRSGARYEDGTLPPEVWREKATCPTLNAFDNSGDSRAVVTIVHSFVDTQVVTKVRRFTPKECERLQGFLDGWTEDQSDSARYKQMGNAVTVNVVEWIGGRV